MKKLRALLPLIEPGIASSTMTVLRSSMRALKRAFAMGRDQHVINALLKELSKGESFSRTECVAPEKGNDAAGMPGPAQLRRLKAKAHALTRRLETMPLRPLTWDDVAKIYAHCYAKARRWFRRCEHKPSATRMHRWRAPVKDHYFQSLFMLSGRRHLSAARKLGSLLGQFHDLAMLREHYDHGSSKRLARTTHQRMRKLCKRIFRKAPPLFMRPPRRLKRQMRMMHHHLITSGSSL